jgi:Uma2 family endonuclease
MSTSTHVTAEQLLMMPDDGRRHELIRGEVTTMAPTGDEHGAIVWDLTGMVAQFIRQHQLGQGYGAETGFVLERDPDTVRAPDAAFVRKGRVPPKGARKGFFPGAPDLAVEVISPGDTYEEVDEKVHQWLAHGTQEVWVVNPRRRTVTVQSSAGAVRDFAGDDVLESPDLLPGFRCPLRELFASLGG